MKKIMIALTMMLLTAATGNAMSYEQARNEALFLTDKMAYELNLTDEQYEAAYEINLDYLMGVTSRDDVFGVYWERRNLDLSYIMLEWQWNAFCAATYFYRPLYWLDGFWHFAVYARYPHRDYFYFGRPVFYATYRGGHAWHVVGGHGYYHSHRDHFRPAHSAGRSHFGMLDRWNRGDFNHGRHHATRPGIGNATQAGGGFLPVSSDHSATQGNRISHSNHSTMQGSHPSHSESSATPGGSIGRSHSSGSFSRSSRSSGSSSHSSGSFSRSSSSSSHSSGSFSRGGGGSSHSSGSFSRGGGSSHSSSAGRSSSGVRHGGGRR